MSNADGERGKQLSFESELVKANEDNQNSAAN
jgi:hypothetical protein